MHIYIHICIYIYILTGFCLARSQGLCGRRLGCAVDLGDDQRRSRRLLDGIAQANLQVTKYRDPSSFLIYIYTHIFDLGDDQRRSRRLVDGLAQADLQVTKYIDRFPFL